MHFSASYEKTRRKARSQSPPRRVRRAVSISTLKRPRNPEPVGDYYGLYPTVNSVTVPAPPLWVSHSTNHTPAPLASSYQPPPTYLVPGAYPATPTYPYPGSYLFQQTTSADASKPATSTDPAWDGIFKYKKAIDYVKSPTKEMPPNPLDDPAVRDEIAHEQKMRLLAEQRHQELMKQQILEIELEKAQKGLAEDEARHRMHRLYMLSMQEQQQQLIPYHPRRSRSTHSMRRRSNADLRLDFDIYHDEARRASHVCSRCHRQGHYSRECMSVPHTHLLEAPPSGSQAGSVRRSSRRRARSTSRGRARSTSRGRARSSSRGSVRDYSDDEWDEEDWDDEEYDDDLWFSEDDEDHYYYDERPRGRRVRAVPGDQGVLVVYTPGGGPGTRRHRNSVRHVVGG